MGSGADTRTIFPCTEGSHSLAASGERTRGTVTTSPSMGPPVPGLQARTSASRVCTRGAIRSTWVIPNCHPVPAPVLFLPRRHPPLRKLLEGPIARGVQVGGSSEAGPDEVREDLGEILRLGLLHAQGPHLPDDGIVSPDGLGEEILTGYQSRGCHCQDKAGQTCGFHLGSPRRYFLVTESPSAISGGKVRWSG